MESTLQLPLLFPARGIGNLGWHPRCVQVGLCQSFFLIFLFRLLIESQKFEKLLTSLFEITNHLFKRGVDILIDPSLNAFCDVLGGQAPFFKFLLDIIPVVIDGPSDDQKQLQKPEKDIGSGCLIHPRYGPCYSLNPGSDALGDACNMELVQSIHDRLRDQIEQHKESHDPEPLELSVSDAAAILRDNGVEEEKILAFRDNCSAQFGDGATLNPANLIDSSRFEVKTADATISLDPEHSYLVETRIIDGRKYLLIPADEDIEVNGFGVRVKGE